LPRPGVFEAKATLFDLKIIPIRGVAARSTVQQMERGGSFGVRRQWVPDTLDSSISHAAALDRMTAHFHGCLFSSQPIQSAAAILRVIPDRCVSVAAHSIRRTSHSRSQSKIKPRSNFVDSQLKIDNLDQTLASWYLCLLYDERRATTYVNKLKRASTSEFKAKDIFRACGLSLLGISNAHVEKDQQKIQSGRGLSPLLLIRDSVNGKVIIADGYHRLCAVYSYDEGAVIPCKIV
jgi:hypothetical protein